MNFSEAFSQFIKEAFSEELIATMIDKELYHFSVSFRKDGDNIDFFNPCLITPKITIDTKNAKITIRTRN